jgi:hypothetical protein
MRMHPAPVALILAVVAAASLPAQTPLTAAHIVYTFEHPQLQPSRLTISIDETGAGRFTSQPGPTPTDATDGVFPTPLDRPIVLDDSLRADLFRYARSHSFFATRCSTTQATLAFTIEEGRRLDLEVQHDRLGLDAELESLQDAVKDRRAWDLPNIAPQLQTIANDQQVMDRARKRAQALLAHSEIAPKHN